MAQSLLKYNTFGIDATCNALVEYDTTEQLNDILTDLVKSGQRWLHIGGGSNLLFLSNHYDGTILHSRIKGIEISDEDDDEVILRVGAGEEWDAFVGYCVEHGWYGLENLSFIPGEVGASAIQNVGAYGVEAGDRIETVEGFLIGGSGDDATNTTISSTVIDRGDCQYAYRSSVFKHELKGRFVVTHVWYRLSKTYHPILTHAAVQRLLESKGIDPATCTAQQMRQAVTEVRQEKLPDPKNIGSAGSFFMNPVVTKSKADELLKEYPDMPHYPAPLPKNAVSDENSAISEVKNDVVEAKNGVKIPAGWLIEQCGWKGQRLGNAGVHPKQALVLINCGGATGHDVEHLSQTIQADVHQKFGIEIHPEVLFIP